MVTVEEMARHIIATSQAMGTPPDNITLQRVLMELQDGDALSEGSRFAERPEEWGAWPVYPQVYREYSAYGGRPITTPVADPLATKASAGDEMVVRSAIARWQRRP